MTDHFPEKSLKSEVILYQTEDGHSRIRVGLEAASGQAFEPIRHGFQLPYRPTVLKNSDLPKRAAQVAVIEYID